MVCRRWRSAFVCVFDAFAAWPACRCTLANDAANVDVMRFELLLLLTRVRTTPSLLEPMLAFALQRIQPRVENLAAQRLQIDRRNRGRVADFDLVVIQR